MDTIEDSDEVSDEVYAGRATGLANMLGLNGYRHRQRRWGAPEPGNECGTVACAAGWATLAKLRVVTIAVDGTMTFDPADLGPIASGDAVIFYTDRELATPTLWRDEYLEGVEEDGAAWLGLSADAARTLFRTTNEVRYHADPEALAVEILRRLGDGRLPRDFDLTMPGLISIAIEINAVVETDDPV